MRTLTFYFLLILNSIFVLYGIQFYSNYFYLNSPTDFNQTRDSVADIKPGNRWIVVTTVSEPTSDVQRLASFTNWNLVVVADTKTPLTWNLPGVHFLSVEVQKSLTFRLSTSLPYKSYTRKNIGYLYAISKGAEWIYDTDDDNKPYGLGLEQFDYEDHVSGLRYLPAENSSTNLFNPYRFFGLPKMWPRGFPLESLSRHRNGKLALCQRLPRSAVQQGLVHHDPDVDAIYRLLHADPESGLDERFNKFAPPVLLSPRTYSPWNSQNTLFHKSAFHTLFLPTSVSFRTTDIWRSYFAQRILHLSGLTVSFTPVNAVQYRNAHNFLKDFGDEKQVYDDAGKILKLIDSWKCSSKIVQECMNELARIFAEHKIWKDDDAKLIEQFLTDLSDLGFEFPPVVEETLFEEQFAVSSDESTKEVNCRRANVEFSVDYPQDATKPAVERAAQKLEYFGEILDWCDISSSRGGMPSAEQLAERHAKKYEYEKNLSNVLVISSNYEWKWAIGLLQRLYAPFFATIIFCGSWYPEKYNRTNTGFPETLEPLNFVHINPAEMRNGFYGYHCLTLINEMRLSNVNGFYLMSDDTHFNIWQRIDFTRVHHLMGVQYEKSDVWWKSQDVGLVAAQKVIDMVKDPESDESLRSLWRRYENGLRKYGYINGNQSAFDDMLLGKSRSISDYFYIPSHQIAYYSALMRLFYKAGLFHELAVNKFLRSVEHQTAKALGGSYLYGEGREEWAARYSVDLVALHPIKLSEFADRGENRTRYCENVLIPWKGIIFDGFTNFTSKMDHEEDWKNG